MNTRRRKLWMVRVQLCELQPTEDGKSEVIVRKERHGFFYGKFLALSVWNPILKVLWEKDAIGRTTRKGYTERVLVETKKEATVEEKAYELTDQEKATLGDYKKEILNILTVGDAWDCVVEDVAKRAGRSRVEVAEELTTQIIHELFVEHFVPKDYFGERSE